MERIIEIFEAVKSNSYPNCKSLAEELEVTPKTIQRDITFMKNRLNVPIEYDKSMHGYVVTGDWDGLPGMDVQVEDLAALFLAKHALGAVNGTQLADALRPAFEKLTSRLEGKVNMNWREIDQAFSVKQVGSLDVDLKMFGKLAEAVVKQMSVEFSYRKVDATVSESRRLNPYHVGEIAGGWYVIGLDLDREALRTFALQRIKGLKVTGGTFEKMGGFDINEHIGSSVGVWDNQSSSSFEVVLEVTGWVARMVQERKWHSSQKVKVLDDYGTRVEVRMTLGNLEEVKQLVLSWGRNVKVIKPDELRDAIREEAQGMLAVYAGGGGGDR